MNGISALPRRVTGELALSPPVPRGDTASRQLAPDQLTSLGSVWLQQDSPERPAPQPLCDCD